MSQQPAVVQPPAPVPTNVVTTDAAALMEVITRAASDPGTDVDKLERLMGLYERITDKRAQQAYYDAMQAAQAEMPAVFKGAKGQNSRYATLEHIAAKMKPVIEKHGFSLTFGTADAPLQHHYRVTCRIAHKAGHSEVIHADVPADGTGAKGGNSSMNVVQAFGSTMTYARRYLTLLAFNIATTDQKDDDGAGAAGSITPEQIEILNKIGKEANASMKAFLKFMNVERIEDIPANQFEKAKHALETKKQGAKQ